MLEPNSDPLEYHIDDEIYKDDIQYFFSLLGDRYFPITEIWAEALSNKFKKTFRPIYVSPYKYNDMFTPDNYLVFNDKLKNEQQMLNRKDIIDLIYPEDLNKQFSSSKITKNIINKLYKKQKEVFVLPFSSVWLDFKGTPVTILGPDPVVAEKYDNKIEHVLTFRKLSIGNSDTTIYNTFDKMLNKHDDYPFFVSPTYSSGGFESKIIYTEAELQELFYSLRPINKTRPFIAASLITNILRAPNINAIVTVDGRVIVINITDQLLRGHMYMGNLYPSAISKEQDKLIREQVLMIGEILYSDGFSGMFGCDFLIADSGCYVIDINPRRQGSYLGTVLSDTSNWIINAELETALGNKIQEKNNSYLQVEYSWAHSKITPYNKNTEIIKEFIVGTPRRPFASVGSSYSAQYYPANHTLIVGNPGIYIQTARTRKELEKTFYENLEKTISSTCSTYEPL